MTTQASTNQQDTNTDGSLPKERAVCDRETDADLLNQVVSGHGLSRTVVVEVPGIEPGSSVASSGLLRAQSATPLLGSTGLADKPV